jgi:phage head maturation protease
MNLERLTFAATGKVEGRTLSGVAHVYGQVTVDGRNHAFAPGAFAKSIAAGRLVSFAYHDETKPLASMAAGSLRLSDGAELLYALDLPEGVSYAEDMRALVASGQIELGMSFAILPGGKFKRADGVQTWTDVGLLSVDPVVLPAFLGTSAILNAAAYAETAASMAVRIRNRLHTI